MVRASLDVGLLDPLLSNLRVGDGSFVRTSGTRAHEGMVKEGRVQDLATILLAERRLVEGLWPLKGDYYDIMDRAIGCFGGIRLKLRDLRDESDGRGPVVHAWVYDETVRWLTVLDSPTEFRLSSKARKLGMSTVNKSKKVETRH